MNAISTAREPLWVRPTRREFPGRPDQVPQVREFVARRIRLHGCPEEAVREIVLCADELAVNAIKYTTSGQPGGRFVVTVRLADHTVRVEVTDAGPTESPLLVEDDEFLDGGRGLVLIAALAQWSGYETTQCGGLAWFEYTYT